MQAVQTMTAVGPPTKNRRPQTAIWLALAIAVLAHIILLLVLANRQSEQPVNRSATIEIQVQYENIQPYIEPPPETVLEPLETTKPPPQPVEKAVPKLAEQATLEPPPIPTPVPTQSIPAKDRPDNLKTPQQLSRAILGSQFITEASITNRIFGPEIPETNQTEAKEFHFPLRPNMISMLDKPMPELPFAYTEGLVYFAYEPGAKGDLQRFWDKITPEFGWRTNYGTEVKCVWVLVIAACGWGRSKD